MASSNLPLTNQQKVDQGIKALRAGQREKARQLLTEVVTADEDNEKAWLWLSSAVDTDQERQLCLENVLTINPHNQAALQGIAKLQSPKAPSPPAQPIEIIYQQYSQIDDIWAKENAELCPYCAAELQRTDTRCQQCKQKLAVKYYRHEKPQPGFHVYWVLILSLSQLFLLQLIIDGLLGEPLNTMVLHGLMIPVFLVLTIFLYLRHTWAHIASLVALFISAALIIAAPYVKTAISDVFADGLIGRTPIFALAIGFSSFITGALRVLQLAGLTLAAFYGIFVVPPDFTQETVLLRAEVNRKASTASNLFMAGDRYAKNKMWAAAVLNWQRAVALDPTRLLYQLSLAQAYEKLGFHGRSLDVLQSANKIVTTPEAKAKIKELQIQVEAKMKQQK